MSTQLVLYPQNHEGYSSSFSTGASSQWIVDGINFNTMNSSSSITNSGTLADILTAQPPNIVNTWYRARADAAVSYPSENNGVLVLHSTSAGKYHTVIYQRLDNLTIGQIYTVTVNVASNTSGSGIMSVINGTTIQGIQGAGIIFGYNNTQLTTTFTAETTQDIFIFTWEDNINNSFYISNISVTTAVVSPSGVYTDLVDGQVICDLYEEEDIPLTLSMDEFKNVAEQVKSYSKDFNLPATKRNNQIFNNMFEITRASEGLIFNPYVRTKCVLKQDGFVLFEGYLRLIDVKDKEGEISYNVNLYSEVIALADILKDRTFSVLDLDELEHEYNKTNIKLSWGSGLPLLNPLTDPNEFAGAIGATSTQVLKYPFIDWTHQFIVGGTNPIGTNATDGNPELMSLEQAFRPCIQLKYLVNKIFADAGFTWTSTFFDSADFGNLYMDFNWGANQTPSDETQGMYIDFPASIWISNTVWQNYDLQYVAGLTVVTDFAPDLNYDNLTNAFISLGDNVQYNIHYYATFQNGTVGVDISSRWAHRNSAGTLIQTFNPLTDTMGYFDTSVNFGEFSAVLDTGDTLALELKASKFEEVMQRMGTGMGSPGGLIAASTGGSLRTTASIIKTNRGELGQWDFLKGIMTMFNLISLADETDKNNIIIETYSDVFTNITNGGAGNLTLAARSIQHDWTDKVDVSGMELKPLTDLNKNTIFKFVEDDEDYAFNVFKRSQYGHLYGSKKWNADAFTILEGTKEIIADPFSATVCMPLSGHLFGFIVPKIYAMNNSGECEGFNNSPRIFYDNGIKDTGASYYIPEQNGLSSENQPEFLQFSHFSDMPTLSGTRDFVFESHQLPLEVGNPPTDNLFSTYWQSYFNELYRPDTRVMTLKVNLSPADIASFVFTDTVMIKNRSFRVNKIEYKPNSLAKVEFILIP